MSKIIRRADILLPAAAKPEKWSVIACDQFTSDPGYWEETCRIVGESPSTLHLILPEAWIGTKKAEEAPERMAGTMERYWKEGVFRTVPESMMAVERRMRSGKIRSGIVAAVDLEAYDYHPESSAAIKATERTVEERLLKRLSMREKAMLECPHILVFYDDPDFRIRKALKKSEGELREEYSFELMQGGGSIRGRSLQGKAAVRLEEAFERLRDREECAFAVGDGNHSLATALLCWEKIRSSLTQEERKTHPARYALAELVNIYDEGVEMEPIHRLLAGTESRDFLPFAESFFARLSTQGEERILVAGTGKRETIIPVRGLSIGQIVRQADIMIEEYASLHGGTEDYIHDDNSARELGTREDAAFLLLPPMEREEIFATVREKKILPRKSFSIGTACDKRYYLECRKIR